LAFAVAVLIAVYFIGRELARSPNFEKLPEALQTSVDLNKEFKNAFQDPFYTRQINRTKELHTKEAIAYMESHRWDK
jgi:uncharacterized protein YjgD (DUF1641 family)